MCDSGADTPPTPLVLNLPSSSERPSRVLGGRRLFTLKSTTLSISVRSALYRGYPSNRNVILHLYSKYERFVYNTCLS